MNILITGGASGLGEAITRILAKDTNNKVYFTYSSSVDSAKKIEEELANTIAIKCDFRDTQDLQSLIDTLKDHEVQVLINNAYSGDFLKSHFHKIPVDDFLDDYKNNILPVITITQAFITEFRKKKFGKIITVLTAALVNQPPIGSAVYVANKAYLEKLTKVWAHENAKFNISSNSVSPSLMQTNMTSAMDERTLEQIKDGHPLKKILTVEEVAQTVLFLVDASNQINGVDILINAGSNLN